MHVVRTGVSEATPDPRVSIPRLRTTVETLSFPRHFVAEPEANARAGGLVADALCTAGFRVDVDGPWRNVVARPRVGGTLVLVGAHYDSVPRCPGADDNASAVAALLYAAEIVGPDRPVAWAAFNREEDGLLGSTELVEHGLGRLGLGVRRAHVLEMLGYTAEAQLVPPGVPIVAPPDGRFLGLLSKDDANAELRRIGRLAPDAGVPTIGLQTWFGIDGGFPDLRRSDHSPFWAAGIPAVLWTDTAEFRNPHYHRASDTPDTLDYDFLARVTALLVRVIETSCP